MTYYNIGDEVYWLIIKSTEDKNSTFQELLVGQV